MILKCPHCGKLVAVFPLQKKTKLELKVLEYLKGKGWVSFPDLESIGLNTPQDRQFVLESLIKNKILLVRTVTGGGRKIIKQVKLEK